MKLAVDLLFDPDVLYTVEISRPRTESDAV